MNTKMKIESTIDTEMEISKIQFTLEFLYFI